MYSVFIFLLFIPPILCSKTLNCTNPSAINCTLKSGVYYTYLYTCETSSSNLINVLNLIKQCTRDNMLGLTLIVQTGLSEALDLDQIAITSILYLNLQIADSVTEPVSLTTLTDLPNIRTLEVTSYQIPNGTFFSHFPRLEKLSIRNSSLPSLPSFSQLHCLSYLSLDSISFLYVESIELGANLRGLCLLMYLQLSNANVVNVSETAFKGLTSLSFLNLTHNSIRSISHNQFRGLYALRMLTLADNDISFLPYQAFQQLPSLTQLNVSGNPFNCSCALQWMQIAESNFSFHFNGPKCYNDIYHLEVTKPANYYNCPPIPVSLQCLNKSRPPCPSPLSCYDTPTSSQCSACPPGYGQVAEGRCIDLEFCSRTPNLCGNLSCVNIPGNYTCAPHPCAYRNGGCDQKCQWNVSVHWCECFYGFEPLNLNSSTCYYVTGTSSYGNTPAVVLCVLFAFILVGAVVVVVVVWLRRKYKGRKLFAFHVASEDDDPDFVEMQEIPVEQANQSVFILPLPDPVL